MPLHKTNGIPPSRERGPGGLTGSVFWPFGVAVGARGPAWVWTSPPHPLPLPARPLGLISPEVF